MVAAVGALLATLFSAPAAVATASGSPAAVPAGDAGLVWVSLDGDGLGQVTSDPEGIDCSDTSDACSVELEDGASVTLTATPRAGSAFVGWDGDCAGVGACVVESGDDGAEVVAIFDTTRLEVWQGGDGIGVVTSSPAGISCGAEADECAASFVPGTVVTLTAVAGSLSTFEAWGEACEGESTTSCTLAMDDDHVVAIVFDAHVLDVEVTGDGEGLVTSDPAGIECDGTFAGCWQRYALGTQVTLTAAPGDASVFRGWGGACTGTGPCEVTIGGDTEVTAELDSAWLYVDAQGDGVGLVTSDPSGIACGDAGATCAMPFTPGTTVDLAVTPDDRSVFVGWGGACSGTGGCTVTLDDDAEVTAELDSAWLRVTRLGDAATTGVVESSAGGLVCPGTCAERYLPGTAVTLAASASAASTAFVGWGGDCTGTTTCALVLADDATVSASFDTGRVSASIAGDGAGTVTSSPDGVSCPGDCRQNYLPGTSVTLTATPAGGKSVFLGWSGACSGTGPCVIDAGTDPSVLATFDSARLFVARDGRGPGLVTSDPAGISCGDDCVEGFLPGATVTLTATQQAGSTFTGWSGACTGLGTCTVTLDTDSSVTASFNPAGTAGKIAFACDNDVCVMDEDGTDIQNLTNSPESREYYPAISPDGSKVVFMTDGLLGGGNPDENLELATIHVDGSNLFQVTDSEGPWHDPYKSYDPDWSPDGTKIAFVATRASTPSYRQIFTINADGTGETKITSQADYAEKLNPKWSPDGTKIAYTWWLGAQDVYVMDADGSNQKNMTPGGGWVDERSPAWSPDGSRIAFVTDKHYDPMYYNHEIYVMDAADGTNQVRVTDTKWIEESPEWSPDGAWIAFSRYGDIYAIEAPPAAGGTPAAPAAEKQLTSGERQDFDPFWTGDQVEPEPRTPVSVGRTGKGRVLSSPAGIDCGKTCKARFTQGSTITLVASPAVGWVVEDWGGLVCQSATTCTVPADQVRKVKVTFARFGARGRPTVHPGTLE